MKTIESIPALLDIIFEDLENASKIRIDYTTHGPYGPDESDVFINVLSVNGIKLLTQYKDIMSELAEKTIDNFQEQMDILDQELVTEFVKQALCRIQKFLGVVVITTEDITDLLSYKNARWTPGYVQCYLNNAESPNPMIPEEVVQQTRMQAWTYYTEVSYVEDYICSFIDSDCSLSGLLSDNEEMIKGEKILIKVPLPVLCVFFRILLESNAISGVTLPELSQFISAQFRTDLQENLDPEEILDLLLSPEIEAIEELSEVLDDCVAYLSTLERQQKIRSDWN